MKKSQVKTMFVFVLIFTLLATLIYAVASTLLSPVDNFADDDGYLDLRGSCKPTSQDNYDGTTLWNISNASLWSNVGGTWKKNVTKHVISPENGTYLFNFTNDINASPQGEYLWNMECWELNTSDSSVRSASSGNRTIRVVYAAPSVTMSSPADGSYNLQGYNISFQCKATASAGWNLTRIDLKTNIDGTWHANASLTNNSVYDVGNQEYIANFSIVTSNDTSIPDGTNLIATCSASQIFNGTEADTGIISNEKSSGNITVNIERPPNIVLNGPADNNWSRGKQVGLQFTITSSFGTSIAPFKARIWTNETGVWMPSTGILNIVNNTATTQLYTFQEKDTILWAVEAFDANDANVFNTSVNRTIRIDATDPVITLETTNNTFSDDSIEILFTFTEPNVDTVRAFINFTGSSTLNYTNDSATSGTQITWKPTGAVPDGVYLYNVTVNDSSGRSTTSGFNHLIVDTVPPQVSSIANQTVDPYCDMANITFTTNEDANHTVYFDTDTDTSDGILVTSGQNVTDHGAVLDFDLSAEVTWYFNITACDLATNCNTTVGQITFITPARVCAGWTQYAVYDELINLSIIQNQSSADLVYFWNATAQDWVYFTAGLTSNAKVQVGWNTSYHVVHLFENTNATWHRNRINLGVYNYNVSVINNFVSIPKLYTFGNFTESFMNSSGVLPSTIKNITGDNTVPNGTTYGPWNMTFFAGWNNSNQDYVNHIFNFTWANSTFLEPCPGRIYVPTCMEVAWVASDYNVTWNGSEVYTNWTKYTR